MQAFGHNRARQREKLGALLEDLGDLQAEVSIIMRISIVVLSRARKVFDNFRFLLLKTALQRYC